MRPLEGACVLDLCDSVAGMLATRHLADLGAAVLRPPSPEDASRHARLRNRGKRLVPEESAAGGEELADVVVIDSPRGAEAVAGGLDRLVIEIRSEDAGAGVAALPSYALSALGGLTGLSGEERPVTPAPVQAAQVVALHAALACTAGLVGSVKAGRFEVIGEECVANCLESALPIFFLEGRSVPRAPNLQDLAWPTSAYHVADGWVGVTCSRLEETRRFLDIVGLRHLVEEAASYDDVAPSVARLDDTLRRKLLGRQRAELAETCQRAGLAVAPALWPADLFGDEHLVARGFFVGDREPHMAFPALFDGARVILEPGPPGAGTRPPPSEAPSNRPLAGLKVVDLTWALAGPFATMLLADLGADVVKLESEAHLDSSRVVGPWAGGKDYDHSGYFRFFNRQKRSISCDFSTPEGSVAVRRMVHLGDVVVENFRAGTLDRRGLGYEDLRHENEGLVMCSVSGFGRTGPRAGWRSYGAGMAETHSGIAAATGGDRPLVPARSYADCVAGLYAALSICAQLYRHRRDGRGSHVDLAQFESCAATVEEAALVGPDPSEAHRVEGSDATGWAVSGAAGCWPVESVQAVAARSLQSGFCCRFPGSGGEDVYSCFPGRLQGRRPAVRRAAPLLGEHTLGAVLEDWEASSR